MTRHYPDLGSASDWLNQISLAARPIRSTTQIWVVTCRQYGISSLVSQRLYGGETSESVAKCRLFSQANFILKFFIRNVELFQRLYHINTLLNGSLTSHIGYLVHLGVEVKFSNQLFYELCETPFMMIKRKQEKTYRKIRRIDYTVITNKLRNLQSIEMRMKTLKLYFFTHPPL